MDFSRTLVRAAAAACAAAAFSLLAPATAMAQEKIKIGILGQFSGPYASTGKHYQEGIDAFLKAHGANAGGRQVEVVYRDIGGANASTAKRLAEELIVRDGAQIIGGFYLSPEPIAAAPVLTETNTPGIVFNGAAKAITEASPMIVRVSNTQFQVGYVQAEWAIKNGYKKTYISVSDFAPGYDLLASFRKRYTELGGEIVGEDKIPLNTVDYSPFVERVARAKPSLFVMFIPGGAPSVNMTKALSAQGLAGRKDLAIIGQVQLEESVLGLFDDSVVGQFDALSYAIDVPDEENQKFKKALRETAGDKVFPNYEAASAWDGMTVIYKMLASQQGRKFDGKAAVEAVKGFKFMGAKGPLTIEPDTRNSTLGIYIRKAVKGPDGKLKLVISDSFMNVKSLP